MLQKACCCYSLRHGTVVIGVGFLIASGIALLMEVALVVEWDDIQARHQNWDNHQGKNQNRKLHTSDMSNSIETAIAIAFFGTIAIDIALAKTVFRLLLLVLILLREFSNYCYCYWYC